MECDWAKYVSITCKQTNHICYCVLSAHTSHYALWCLTGILLKPVLSKVKQCCSERKAFRAVFMLFF